MGNFYRSFALEDISIRSDGTGRTVEAYAAIFNTDAEIYDAQGHYLERIDPSAFNKAIRDAAPQGSRSWWTAKVMFNHGKDMYGTPSDRFAMPLGTPEDIRADGRGLLTVTRYSRTAQADEVLELIKDGAITAQSFQGSFLRSDKPIPRNGFRPDADGNLTRVTRTEVSLKEYGPAIFAAYPDAAIVGVRSLSDLPDAALLELATQRFAALTRQEPNAENDTPNPGAVPGEPRESEELAHSARFIAIRRQLREKGIL